MRIYLKFYPTTNSDIRVFRRTKKLPPYCRPLFDAVRRVGRHTPVLRPPFDWDYYQEQVQIDWIKKCASDLATIQRQLFRVFQDLHSIDFPVRSDFPDGPEGKVAFDDTVRDLDASWKLWLTDFCNQNGCHFDKTLTLLAIVE